MPRTADIRLGEFAFNIVVFPKVGQMSDRTILIRDGMAALIASAEGPDDAAEKADMRSGVPRRADDAIALIQLNHASVDEEWLPGLGNRDDATRYAIDDPDNRRERLATIGNFAAGVAHEINNPLGAVLASVQAALELLDRDERELVRECLETAQQGSRRCIDVVRGLLRFCRDEPAHRIPFDLCEICRFAISLTRSYAENRGCRLESRLPAERVEIPCSPIELEIAFVNVLRNAVEAGATRIETGVEVVGEDVRIVFRDNGRGIRPGRFIARARTAVFVPRGKRRHGRRVGGSSTELSWIIAEKSNLKPTARAEPAFTSCCRSIRRPKPSIRTTRTGHDHDVT